MGLIKKSSIEAYWDTSNPSQSTQWFIEHFNRDRFQLLLKFLHFADNRQVPPQDHPDHKLYKVKVVTDQLVTRFRRYYNPHKDISIDESMYGYRRKNPYLRQYMPQKHHARFGIKLWCLCDAETHYTKIFEVYKGAHDQDDAWAEEGVTYALVMPLLSESDLLHQGYHIGLDNYFSSPKLFQDLFQLQTCATGTVRSNQKGLPKQILKEKLRNGQVAERRKGPLLCMAYKDKTKKPTSISTKAKAGFQDTTNARGEAMVEPKIVVVYNSATGGVDSSDAQLYVYLSERRTMKWTHKLVFALFGRSVLSAYLLYNEHVTDAGNKLTRYQFTVSIVESLMGRHRPGKVIRKRKSKVDIETAAADDAGPILPQEHEYAVARPDCKLVKIGANLRRMFVHHSDSNKKTTWQCSRCEVPLCAECFVPYHNARNIPLSKPNPRAEIETSSESKVSLPTKLKNEKMEQVLSAISRGMLLTIDAQLKDVIEHEGEVAAGTPLTNLICERNFGHLDSSQRRRPHQFLHHHSSVVLLKQTAGRLKRWFRELPLKEQKRLWKGARKGGKELRKQHQAKDMKAVMESLKMRSEESPEVPRMQLTEGQLIAVACQDAWYPAVVTQSSQVEKNVTVSFAQLGKGLGIFKWPTGNDVNTVSRRSTVETSLEIEYEPRARGRSWAVTNSQAVEKKFKTFK